VKRPVLVAAVVGVTLVLPLLTASAAKFDIEDQVLDSFGFVPDIDVDHDPPALIDYQIDLLVFHRDNSSAVPGHGTATLSGVATGSYYELVWSGSHEVIACPEGEAVEYDETGVGPFLLLEGASHALCLAFQPGGKPAAGDLRIEPAGSMTDDVLDAFVPTVTSETQTDQGTA
jgi:hypothetical protein